MIVRQVTYKHCYCNKEHHHLKSLNSKGKHSREHKRYSQLRIFFSCILRIRLYCNLTRKRLRTFFLVNLGSFPFLGHSSIRGVYTPANSIYCSCVLLLLENLQWFQSKEKKNKSVFFLNWHFDILIRKNIKKLSFLHCFRGYMNPWWIILHSRGLFHNQKNSDCCLICCMCRCNDD